MGRRYRRRHRDYRSRHRAYQSRRRNGWGMNLYRNTRAGKCCGVCAGLADHWEVEHWVIRLAAVILFLVAGPLVFWAYIAGWILLAPRPRRSDYRREEYIVAEDENVEMEYDERHHAYRPRKMFRYGESTSVRLQKARERLDAALRRVEDMESYVTSRQYELNNEFSKL
ncbi:MAG: PspC domain-containing protein [Gammaproteobacteria bacterium]|nr:PspC domain-containing protein [Gammaproteobacteria bacterium]